MACGGFQSANSLDRASFWSGMSFIASTIILPWSVSHFTANPVLIGLIPFISSAGIFLPQLFMANAVERGPRKKFLPLCCWPPSRISWQPASRD